MPYSAQIILDSKSPDGVRLTTMEVTYPRMVHSELMTHRVFSRNAASSRAIPVTKSIERVMTDPAMPVEWGMNQAGMQANTLADELTVQDATAIWLNARNNAVRQAKKLHELGIHKQIVNRLLEPFSWITVIVSSTEWQNYFAQRATEYSPLAQPELRKAADAMLDLLRNSEPILLDYGDWHTPLIQPDEHFELEDRKKISAARCARVSYLTHDGVRDPSADLDMFVKLNTATPMHASPFEHVATPVEANWGVTALGNFYGWRQMRHDLENAHRKELMAA